MENMESQKRTDDKPIRGFVFTCSNKTEQECFEKLLM